MNIEHRTSNVERRTKDGVPFERDTGDRHLEAGSLAAFAEAGASDDKKSPLDVGVCRLPRCSKFDVGVCRLPQSSSVSNAAAPPASPQDLSYFIEGVKNGNRRVLAKAITLVESSHPDHRRTARRLIEALLPFSGRAVRVGITGVPGAGKSTFIESFGTMLTGMGRRVAVLAVDPSSKRSGGSILADKTRMEKLAAHPRAFIRPSPSGETSGGVAKTTREAMLLCEAAGFDVIIVETVGVGQSETTVAGMVDFFLVLMITGAGDSLQGIKMGVLELASAVAINKADGENMELAERTCKELGDALHLMHSASAGWQPRVATCSALTLAGLGPLWEMIMEHNRWLSESGALEAHRKQQNLEWMWALLESRLKDRFINCPGVREKIAELEGRILGGGVTPTVASRELFLKYINESSIDKNIFTTEDTEVTEKNF